MKHNTPLTQEQRYHISGLLKAGNLQKDIATSVGVHKSTISRELRRNCAKRGYFPRQADELATKRRHEAQKHVKFTLELQAKVTEQLLLDHSPDQISGALKLEGICISHERIYQFILANKNLGGTLYTHLRHSGKKRKKRYGSHDRRGQIKNRISIEARPNVVDKKERLGDWEGDTIIGKQQQKAIVTLVDRASRLTRIGKVATKHAPIVADIMVNLLKPLAAITHTITLDNGTEFSHHECVSKALKVDIYFAHPYSSWERGLNENTNGLIRQYIKKGSSFEHLTKERIQFIENRLNNRPRKSLGYLTPNQVWNDAIARAG